MTRKFKKTTLSIAVAQAALICGGAAFAQSAQAQDNAAATSAPGADKPVQTIVVSGQRAALQSATKIKQNAEEIVDAVVAEEAGKLPDRSITEVLQRVVGVTMDRNRSRGDPEHFSVEGSGISVRGLTWGSSTLNGRESFSSGYPGRELSWGDIPTELMSAVVVHKNPPAELLEGGVSGQVDLRTALPFDYKESKVALSTSANYTELGKKTSPALSGLFSKRWKTSTGEWGALFDISANRTNSYNDTVQLDAYYPRTDIKPGETVWVPKSGSFRRNTGDNTRGGVYGALQWKNDGLEHALTYFHSAYKLRTVELATFTGMENAYKSTLTDPVFDANNVLQSARYTYPLGGHGANKFAAGGIGFNSNTGYFESSSATREIAFNTKWKINNQWSLQNDFQWVNAEGEASGDMYTLNTFVPSMDLDTRRNPANVSFDAAAQAHMADRNNYFMGFVMPALNKNDGKLFAWKADGRFRFDDHPIMRDVRFGVRLTERKANYQESNRDAWTGISRPWEVEPTKVPGQLPTTGGRASFGYLDDPRYGDLVKTRVENFSNFFNGKVGVPAPSVVPDLGWVRDPANFTPVMLMTRMQCIDGVNYFKRGQAELDKCADVGSELTPLVYNDDPSRRGQQSEKTSAGYMSTRFGFDELRFPVEGSVGVRVVHTKTVAHGYTVFDPKYDGTTRPEVPRFGKIDEPIDGKNSYTDVLPSLNLKMEITPQLQARFAFAKSMYRPAFSELREYISLEQKIQYPKEGEAGTGIQGFSYVGRAKGSSALKPTKASSFDATLEWYPGNGSSLTAAFFYKDVRDIILQSTVKRTYNSLAGSPQDFVITSPDNVADGEVAGLELAGQTYFNNVPGLDKLLPEWAKGFGISANYTYIDSKQKLHNPFDLGYCPSKNAQSNTVTTMFGCDTNGVPFTDLPLQYLSKHAANLMFYYDSGPLSARLAYSWRDRYLQGVDVNGTRGEDATSADPIRAGAQDVKWGLPTWQEATGQLDFGMDYKFSENIRGSFSANNVLDVTIKQTQQQHIGNMGRAWFQPGRSYRLSLQYQY